MKRDSRPEAWKCDRCGHLEMQPEWFWQMFKFPPYHSKVMDNGEKCGGIFMRPVATIRRVK